MHDVMSDVQANRFLFSAAGFAINIPIFADAWMEVE